MICKENEKEKGSKSFYWKIFVIIGLIFISASFCILKTDAAVSKYINYQGKLTDIAGTPVADANYSVRFRIYNNVSADAGNPCNPGVNSCMWESVRTVGTQSGLFSLSLGDTNAFTDADFNYYDGSTYYLAVKVGADSEMTPRKRVSGALYALNSDRLGGKQETEFADLDENEIISGLWTFTGASVDVQNTLFTGDLNVNGNATFTLGAIERIVIDAETTTHTDAQGIIDIDLKTDSSMVSAIDVKLKSDAGLPAGTYPFGYKAHLVPHSGDNSNAARVAYYADVASDEALVAGDFNSEILGYLFMADPFFNNSILGSATVTSFSSRVTSSSSGGLTGFSADQTQTGTGNLIGSGINGQHSGTALNKGIFAQVTHSGTGNLYGIDLSATGNAGHDGNIYGIDLHATNNSAANGANALQGLALLVSNPSGSAISTFSGIDLEVDASGTQSSAYGMVISNAVSSVLDSMIRLNGNGSAITGIELSTSVGTAIDLSNATVASADLLLSQGTEIKDLSGNRLSLDAHLVPATGDTYDIGENTYDRKWRDAYFEGTVYAGSTLTLSDAGIIDTNSNLVLSASGANYVDIQDTLYIDGLQLDGNGQVNGNLNGTGYLGSLASPWSNAYLGATDASSLTVANGITATGDITFKLGAAERVKIDASTVPHGPIVPFEIDYTRTGGGTILNLNVDSPGGVGGNLSGYSASMRTSTNDSGTVTSYQTFMTDNASTSASFTGYSVKATKKNLGRARGVMIDLIHDGSGDIEGRWERSQHNGTGDLYGSFEQYRHSGSGDIYGRKVTVQHDTTAAPSAEMYGIDMFVWNTAQIQDVYGLNLDFNLAPVPTSNAIGINIDASFGGALDSFIDINGSGQFGIDMNGATFSSGDIRLRNGSMIQGLTPNLISFSDGINVGNTTNVSAGNIRWTGADFQGYDGSSWHNFANLFASTDVAGTALTYSVGLTNDFAVGGNTLAAPFSVDESLNTVRIGDGSTNSQITMYDTGFSTGDIIFANNQFEFGNNLMPASGDFYNIGASPDSRWKDAYFNGFISTGRLLAGGATQGTTYNRFGIGNTDQGLFASNDVYISGELEVDGAAYFDGGHTDIAENIIITENGVDKQVQFIEDDGFMKTDLAGSIVIADSDHSNKGTLTSVSYDKRIVGIIATKPSMIISGGIGKDYGYPIVLAGRIKTNVCNENGTIEIGDFITTSSTPGYGMKATEPGMVVGQALEEFNGAAGECGQIMVFQNIGWYHNAAGVVSNAVTFGLENVPGGDFSNINTNVPQTGDLHLTGKLIGYNNKWVIDENGIFIVHETLPDGSILDLYGLMSVNKEITMSGQAQLSNGQAEVLFENDIDQLIDEDYKVLVTPNEECNGLFVIEKTEHGFVVKELNSGTSNITFDWMVVGQRAGFASNNNTNDNQPVIPPASHTDDSSDNSGSSLNSDNLDDSADNIENTDNTDDTQGTSDANDSTDTNDSADNNDQIDSTDNSDSSDTQTNTADSSDSSTEDSSTDSSTDSSGTGDSSSADSGSADAGSSDGDSSSADSGSSDSGSTE